MRARDECGPQDAGLFDETAIAADLAALSGRAQSRPAPQRYDVIVIGGGQAGLAVGRHLQRRGLSFVILDAAQRTGDSWRKRWDSLRLFTPARFDALPGMPFPAPGNHFPTKDEMAAYLEAYARRFELPVRLASRVTRLFRREGRYILDAAGSELEAQQVVVAMANYQQPRIPEYAMRLGHELVQLHSADYRGPSQLRAGGVLIVGAGNSGAEIARELAPHHPVWISGPDVGQLPFDNTGRLGRLALNRLLLRGIFHRVLTIRNRVGRGLRPRLTTGSGPLIRVRSRHLAALGVVRVARVTDVADGLPRLADGSVPDVANVIWCTGYRPGFSSWIELPVFDAKGQPCHEGGIIVDAPGLYFVGLHFLYALSSAMIHGVGRDAERIVAVLSARADRAKTFATSG